MAQIDIRQHGSGNVGSTNALRTLGLKGGLLSLLGDIFKTIAALALPFFLRTPDLGVLRCRISVIIGHNWSVFLRFKGGKGVAVSALCHYFIIPLGRHWLHSYSWFWSFGVENLSRWGPFSWRCFGY